MERGRLLTVNDDDTIKLEANILAYRSVKDAPVASYLTTATESRSTAQLPHPFHIEIQKTHSEVFESLGIDAWQSNLLMPDQRVGRGELKWRHVLKDQEGELYCGWIGLFSNPWLAKTLHRHEACNVHHLCPKPTPVDEKNGLVGWVHVCVSTTMKLVEKRVRSKSPGGLASRLLTMAGGEANAQLISIITTLLGRLGSDFGHVLQKDWISSVLALQRFHAKDASFSVDRNVSLQLKHDYPYLHHLPFQVNLDVNDLEMYKRYFRFAMASYGHLALSAMAGAGTYIVKLPEWKTVKSSIVGSEPDFIHRFLAIPADDILLYEATTNYHPAILLCVDRAAHCLVLVVRGSFSSSDATTDLVCEYVNYPYATGHVHKGFLASARAILDEHLDTIKSHLHNLGWNRLRIVGHSLGGSVASLLTMLLVDTLTTIDLDAICFAPAGTVSLELAISKRYHMIKAVTCRWDWVSRSSWGALLDLIWCLSSVQTGIFTEDNFDQLQVTMDRLGLFHDFTTMCLSQESIDAAMIHEKLYPTGTIYLLQPEGDTTHTLLSTDEEQWCLQHVPQIYLSTFVVHSRMFLDHLPSMYESRLAACHFNAMKRVGLVLTSNEVPEDDGIELKDWTPAK
jgi:hypothetical protein